MGKHKRAKGARPYRTNYNPEQLDAALLAVKNGVKPWKAAKDHGVPTSTLNDWVKGKYSNKHGGQIWLPASFELAVVGVLNELLDWKVPLTRLELQLLVKNYLDLSGVTTRFANNMPGRDWARKFLQRHGLSVRVASGIKHARASLSSIDIENYFSNLKKELEGVDPSQIYNYDETNFTDDPSRKKCIVRRGVKRLERISAYSKQAFSVMFCGSAAGDYLPPMVVYKAKHCYDGWTSDGIKGAVYDSTESGWFDMRTFEKWFDKVFLEHVKEVSGPKVIIGDNLSSHFSPNVIALCKKHNVRFLTLVPNSTHLCQPLDVAVFRPMKVLWRAMLTGWKIESRSIGTIPKATFPSLLARVFCHLKSSNLVSGFRACGIVPLDSSQVLRRLPGKSAGGDISHANMRQVLNDSVVELLKNHLGVGDSSTPKKRSRGKKVTEPGKAITIADVNDGEVNWVCNDCDLAWVAIDDNRWIVCDKCDKQYHLHCSGVQYPKEEYYDIDIDSMQFICDECDECT